MAIPFAELGTKFQEFAGDVFTNQPASNEAGRAGWEWRRDEQLCPCWISRRQVVTVRVAATDRIDRSPDVLRRRSRTQVA